MVNADLSQLPRVDDLLRHPELTALGLQREIVKALVRSELESIRRGVQDAEASESTAQISTIIVAAVVAQASRWSQPAPRRVINASGVLLHTNLGRAPLCDRAIEQMVEAAGACDLEYDLARGVRGSRFDHLRELLRHVLHVPDAHVVNNGAAALMLACRALTARNEQPDAGEHRAPAVALGRSQMVEIGDGFRVASMIESGGCRVHEVGATNRVHLRDYEQALEAGARAILWVHASNFELHGFVKQAGLAELAKLAKAHEVALIADLGSGSLGGPGHGGEPSVRDYLDAGADLVTFSGDKLLGGPQAGLLAGRAELVEACRRHPMARALRPDKTSLAALRATLYEHAREGAVRTPLARLMAREPGQIEAQAQALQARLIANNPLVAPMWRLEASEATVGGGSLPGHLRPSTSLVYTGAKAKSLARCLRLGTPAIVGRLHEAKFYLDLASVHEHELEELATVLTSTLADFV